jgi:hypothetical protein
MSNQQSATHPAFDLLRAGIPLSLLCDLALPLDSRAVFTEEPADTTWVHAQSA